MHTAPGDVLALRYTPWNIRYARGVACKAIVRADLRNAERIVAQMASDLRELKAPGGAVTHDDLVLRGWKASQISGHFTAALERARRQAGEDA